MKRFTFILIGLSALFVFAFTSCGDTITEVQQVVQPNTLTRTYTVGASDWSTGSDDVGPYLFCAFREPALTSTIFNNGTMTAYLRFSNGNLSPLPFSDFWVDQNGYQYEEYVTCEFEPGWVTFIFKADDQFLAPTFDYEFLVRFMW